MIDLEDLEERSQGAREALRNLAPEARTRADLAVFEVLNTEATIALAQQTKRLADLKEGQVDWRLQA